MPRRRRDGGFLLPDVVDPPRVSLCLEIPNEPNHLLAFWGTLYTLTYSWNWHSDESETAALVSRVWSDVYRKAKESFYNGDCINEDCLGYPTSSPRITWFPEDPYHPGDSVPDGYIFHPWTIVSGGIVDTIISEWGLGYRVGDVYTDVTKLPITTWLPDFIENLGNLPSFTISDLVGTGTVKLEFLNIPQGGRALIQVDGEFNLLNLRLVELNKDLVSFPQETEVPITVNVEIEHEGTHEVKVSFLPTVDDSLIPVFFGGGLRSIEICGLGVTPMPDDPCCPDELDLLGSMNSSLEKLVQLINSGFKIVPIGGSSTPPDATAGDCAPAFFDHDTDETDPEVLGQREKALCITIERYIKAVLLAALRDMGAPDVLVDWVDTQIPQTVPLSLSKITVVYPSILEGLAAFFDAVSGGFESSFIACQMIAALSGDKNNTFTNFKNSLTSLTEDPMSAGVPLVGLVSSTNGVKDNYLAFNKALEAANEEDLSAYTCPCEEVVPEYCGEPLDLVPWGGEFGGNATVITLVAPDIYHITNSTAEGGTYYAAIKDSNGKCLKFEMPGGEYTYQTVQSYYSRGCCDDSDGSAIPGDFSGNEFEGVQWNADGDAPIDTYVKITCQDCCTEIPLEDGEDTGCTIIYMGECIYRFNNSTATHTEGGDIFYFSFRAVDGSCLHVENSDNPDFPTQGVGTDTNTIDCDDVPHSFTGGFTPSDLKSAKWFGSAEQKPTYFKITLA